MEALKRWILGVLILTSWGLFFILGQDYNKQPEPAIKGTRFSIVDDAFLGRSSLLLLQDDSTKALFLFSTNGCIFPYETRKRR